MHACMHALHYLALPYLTLRHVTLITLQYTTLHYIALHYIHTWTPKYMYILPFSWCVHLKWFPAQQNTH